jgi:hypothetical protein
MVSFIDQHRATYGVADRRGPAYRYVHLLPAQGAAARARAPVGARALRAVRSAAQA